MKYIFIAAVLLTATTSSNSQVKTFIDVPYLETMAKVGTLVKPDLIYLDILLQEKDTKNRVSVEELENKMANTLENLGVDVNEQLSMTDLASNFKTYFLKTKDVMKSKTFQLILYDAQTAGRVMVSLENQGISNIRLARTEYSKMDELKLKLKSRAMSKAKSQAEYLLRPLNQKVGAAIHIIDRYYNVFSDSSSLDEVVVITGYASQRNKAPEPLDIEFKSIKIESEVSVKFKID